MCIRREKKCVWNQAKIVKIIHVPIILKLLNFILSEDEITGRCRKNEPLFRPETYEPCTNISLSFFQNPVMQKCMMMVAKYTLGKQNPKEKRTNHQQRKPKNHVVDPNSPLSPPLNHLMTNTWKNHLGLQLLNRKPDRCSRSNQSQMSQQIQMLKWSISWSFSQARIESLLLSIFSPSQNERLITTM